MFYESRPSSFHGQQGSQAPSPKAPRLLILDAVRGVAVGCMIIFHGAWDLDTLGITQLNMLTDPFWRSFGRVIAASFLGLAGISLVLAHHAGIRWPTFWKRLASVAGGALIVSAGTYAAFPHAFVHFGILHAMALGSLFALPFVALPAYAALCAGGLVLAAPFLPFVPRLNGPAFWWLGLADDYRPAVDYIPLLPWLAPMLAGIACAKIYSERLNKTNWRPQGWPGQALVQSGRWSLPIYLVHQPVLYGALWMLAKVMLSPETADLQNFNQGCVSVCAQSGMTAEICTKACSCTANNMHKQGLLSHAAKGILTGVETEQMNSLARSCLKQHQP